MARFLSPLLLVAALGWAQEAAADVPPPEENTICDGKKAGDACSTASVADGRCVADTCSRLDYSNGVPPQSVEYACQRCAPASEAGAGEAKGGAETPAAPSEPPGAEKGCSVDPVGAPAAGLLTLALAAIGRRRRGL